MGHVSGRARESEAIKMYSTPRSWERVTSGITTTRRVVDSDRRVRSNQANMIKLEGPESEESETKVEFPMTDPTCMMQGDRDGGNASDVLQRKSSNVLELLQFNVRDASLSTTGEKYLGTYLVSLLKALAIRPLASYISE